MQKSVWIDRSPTSKVQSPKSKTTWAAVALAVVSLCVQVTNFIRVDLKPLIEGVNKANTKLEQIERRLEDHERRIQELENSKFKTQNSKGVGNDKESVKEK